MKPSDIISLRKVEIYDNHLNKNLRYSAGRRLRPVRGGELGTYENILVDVLGGEDRAAPWPVKRLLFLSDYGNDMPRETKQRLRIEGLGVVLAPHDGGGWTCFLFSSTKVTLRLCVVGGPKTRDDELAPPPPEILKVLNHKRPYHFEISYWALEGFLGGETGWGYLRENLLVVVRAGREYVARLEAL